MMSETIKPIPKIRTRQQFYEAQRDYARCSEPIIQVLCNIEATTMHGIRIASGVVERVENYTEEQLRQRAMCYEQLSMLRRSIFREEEIELCPLTY